MNFDPSTLFTAPLGVGILYLLIELVRRWRGRGQEKIDAAAVITGAAVQLAEPLRQQLEEAWSRCRDLQSSLDGMGDRLRDANDQIDRANNNARAANRELDEARVEVALILGWAQKANDLLERNHLPIEPIPIRGVQ